MTESEIISLYVSEKYIQAAKLGYLARIHSAKKALSREEFEIVQKDEQVKLERLLKDEKTEKLHKWFDFKFYNSQTDIIIKQYEAIIKKTKVN